MWLAGSLQGSDDAYAITLLLPDPKEKVKARQSAQAHEKALRSTERKRQGPRYLAASLALRQGEVRSCELNAAGVSRPVIKLLTADGVLARLRYGWYGPGPAAAAYVASLNAEADITNAAA